MQTLDTPKLSNMLQRLERSERIGKIVPGDSKAHDPLQLADMIGGAAVEAWEQGVAYTELMRLVRAKVTTHIITPDMPMPAP